ncbi:MAG: EamA family transporter [Thermoleophilia bacterium]|nr:EamA family transporter [Thermoleophilia bacterium]
MGRAQGDLDAWTLAAFAGVVVVGGANFVAVKETVGELEPLYGAATRFGLASLVFFAILALTRTHLPRGLALVGAALYGALGFGTAYALMYFALVELTVGVAAVLMASVPVFTLLLAVVQRLEPMTLRGLAGGALAVSGIAVLSANSLGGDVPLRYLLAAIVAPVVVAESTIVAKRFPRTDPIATNAVGMLVGAALLAIASFVAGEAWVLPETGNTWLAAAWLVLAGSVGLFWLFLVVVKRWTASASTFAIPLMPVVALALAATLQGEGIGWPELAGGVLVIGAVYVGVLRRERERPELAPADPGGCRGAEEEDDRARAPEAAPVPARS